MGQDRTRGSIRRLAMVLNLKQEPVNCEGGAKHVKEVSVDGL